MLIKSLSLKEFKCFEQVDIDFGKITLLTGANSSGKSSLINALLGIMQSNYFPLYFALNGHFVNMGGYDDVIRKKTDENVFTVDIEFENNYYSTKWKQNERTEQPELYEFRNREKFVIRDKDDLAYIELTFTLKEFQEWKNITKKKYESLSSTEYQKIWRDYNGKYDILKEGNYEILRKTTSEVVIKYKDSFNRSMNGSDNSNFEVDYEIDRFFNYMGSFRLPPERTYYRKPTASKIGVNGEGYIDQIIEWEESNNNNEFQQLLKAISNLGLIHSIESNKMKGGRFELNVKVNENSTLASLTDVGFGISQFLPIIVADLQLNSQSCLAVSQPEIHLHPKIQATLGDYFAKQVKETEKQYIVETHSEYLINRLRLLIVKGELQPEDVKLYYMENDGDKTTTYPIELTTDGQIKNAPQGFFDTYEMDVMDIALFASAQ
ncbi:DUF3696 domain-containing protein [Arcicella rosea]|uniref:Putative ATPase n=1 Tax=Arcicella rosea TaxID=502909 RepID=A0A841ETP9_9BACT|nr:DUF3696 domain-containing protein [Arcicella rosea]MBB6004028.1 putative ATPase [Arcicella rosea]